MDRLDGWLGWMGWIWWTDRLEPPGLGNTGAAAPLQHRRRVSTGAVGAPAPSPRDVLENRPAAERGTATGCVSQNPLGRDSSAQ